MKDGARDGAARARHGEDVGSQRAFPCLPPPSHRRKQRECLELVSPFLPWLPSILLITARPTSTGRICPAHTTGTERKHVTPAHPPPGNCHSLPAFKYLNFLPFPSPSSLPLPLSLIGHREHRQAMVERTVGRCGRMPICEALLHSRHERQSTPPKAGDRQHGSWARTSLPQWRRFLLHASLLTYCHHHLVTSSPLLSPSSSIFLPSSLTGHKRHSSWLFLHFVWQQA